MPVSILTCTLGLIPVRSKTSLQAFRCSSLKIENAISFCAADSIAQRGIAPTTRIGHLILTFLRSSPSSTDDTPRASTPDASIV